jgi:hypothetical protein
MVNLSSPLITVYKKTTHTMQELSCNTSFQAEIKDWPLTEKKFIFMMLLNFVNLTQLTGIC